MRRRIASVFAALVALIALVTAGTPPRADDRLEIFDAHLHYNWEPKPLYTLTEVLALLAQNRVTGILATSRPNDGTHALVDAKAPGLWVVPFIRPYRVRADVASWFGDPAIYDLIEAQFDTAKGWRGIGEFHIAGRAAASPWVKKTADFAVRHGLFLHAHADDAAIELLFGHNPKGRIIWAHTGFGLAPERVAALLERYPQLWGELSYRSGITDGSGRLTAEWRALFERFPDRFLIGSDTWIDERWASYGDIIAGYRRWLADLSRPIAEKIASGNARALFGGATPAVR